MAKDGSTKAKSADDHKAARQAAQARKKRGKGGPKAQAAQYVPLHQIVKDQKQFHQRKQYVANVLKHIDQQVDKLYEELNQKGFVLVNRKTQDGEKIVQGLKDRCIQSEFNWNDMGDQVAFAREKK